MNLTPDGTPDWPLEHLELAIKRWLQHKEDATGDTSCENSSASAGREFPSSSDQFCVLLSTGSFSPIHKGHVQMMSSARLVLQDANYTVLGGYLSPSHDSYVAGKSRGKAYVCAAHRAEMVRVAIRDHPWLRVGLWEARQVGRWPDYPEVARSLQTVTDRLGRSVRVFYVCGSDHARRCNLFSMKGIGIVAVSRDEDRVPKSSPKKMFFACRHSSTVGAPVNKFSSTRARVALKKIRKSSAARDAVVQFLGQGVTEYILSHELYGSGKKRVPSQPDSSECKKDDERGFESITCKQLPRGAAMKKLNLVLDSMCAGGWIDSKLLPAEIFDNVLLGNMQNAKDVAKLKRLGVTHILNCAPSVVKTKDLYAQKGFDVIYKEVDARDVPGHSMSSHLPTALSIFESARKSTGVIFIHCFAGINRSATLALACIMKLYSVNIFALAYRARQSRPGILTNQSFREQLIDFAHEQGLCREWVHPAEV